MVAHGLCSQLSSLTFRGTQRGMGQHSGHCRIWLCRSQRDILWGGRTGSSFSCQLPCVLRHYGYDISEQMWLSSPSELSAQLPKQFSTPGRPCCPGGLGPSCRLTSQPVDGACWEQQRHLRVSAYTRRVYCLAVQTLAKHFGNGKLVNWEMAGC